MRLYPHSWLFALLLLVPFYGQAEVLPAWQEGTSRQSILNFVDAVTREGSPDYLPEAQRIAVFDNDGTLWSEKPVYFQVLFALDEVRRQAPQHPEWKTQQPFKAVLENDQKTLDESGMKGIMQIVAATHSGMSNEAFTSNAQRWLASARHPRTHKRYTEMVFQPMLELLNYLRSKGFKTYIVSGGEVAFMRTFAEDVYGIPPEQVIGTTLGSRFENHDGQLSVQRLPQLVHNNDGPGKVESIDSLIGRRPVLAVGNSDGDLPMLQWTAAAKGKHLAVLVHHTDEQREWAYDRQSKVGRLDKALDEAKDRSWVVVDMAKDWKRIYPFDH